MMRTLVTIPEGQLFLGFSCLVNDPTLSKRKAIAETSDQFLIYQLRACETGLSFDNNQILKLLKNMEIIEL